ncbi:phage tail assembly protein [Streptomyces noursei]|uniref:phage tail assembly protein n=1 Tax=Streptomyces noursei TaxID=1971 RepID=UPI0023B788A7|nr:phage tail assembly protein [Streptomyces noursei]
MAVRKIADLRTEAELKYADLPLETAAGVVINLRNVLRLDDAARRTAQTLIASLDVKEPAADGSGFDQLDHQARTIRDLLLLVADQPQELAREIDGWDLALRLHVMELWTEGTQAPEASSSAS